MEFSQSSIRARVGKIKENMFNNVDPYSYLCPSAYDTAWLAMIPDTYKPSQPMFKNCLDWLLNNQKHEGFWGECDAFGKPTIETIPATLASLVALKKWKTGALIIEKGLEFIDTNAEQLLKGVEENCPRWFAIIFPAMVELAESVDLEVVFPETVKGTVSYLYCSQKNILEKEELACKHYYPPLLSYLEALPRSYTFGEEDIFSNLSCDGSLFQSPSATAKAFLATGKKECLVYLQSLVQRCPNGVPQTFPVDEDLIKLCMVNHLQRLGLSEHFAREIEDTVAQVHRNYMEPKSWIKPSNMIEPQILKESLAFQLLRMHGYKVSPLSFSRFLHHDEIRAQIEKHYECFTSAMLNTYRASNLMFCGEYEAEEARSFSRKLLEKTVQTASARRHVKMSTFHKMIEHELNVPWLARLDHLEHRMWIEESEANSLWKGKASYNRISYLHNDQLLQLARENYEFRQSIYKYELEELKRWSEKWGLSTMGFGREKTTYCYFAVAAGTSLPHDSYIRTLAAKSAIIITVADDFFDMEGSLNELESLTYAVRKWDSRGLSSHSKVVFYALDNLVNEASAKYLQQVGNYDITNSLRDLWHETFTSWLIEAKWTRTGYTPSLDDYLMTGMTSIATHTLVLPASCFLKLSLPNEKLRPAQYETITKLLMVISRLLNDIQSYQKENKEGKLNSVMIKLVEDPESNIEDSIAFVREIIEKRKKELLEHALIEGHSDLPKASKQLHLACLKVFQMFFNSGNQFDSNNSKEMLEDISKAIYVPVSRNSKPFKVVPLHSEPKKKYASPVSHSDWCFKHYKRTSTYTARQVSQPAIRAGYEMVPMAHKVALGFL